MDIIRRGRKKLFPQRITLPMTDTQLEAVDSRLREGETRLEFIRKAIDDEIGCRFSRNSSGPSQTPHLRASIVHEDGLYHYLGDWFDCGDCHMPVRGIGFSPDAAVSALLAAASLGHAEFVLVTGALTFPPRKGFVGPPEFAAGCRVFSNDGIGGFEPFIDGIVGMERETLKHAIEARGRRWAAIGREDRNREISHRAAVGFRL